MKWHRPSTALLGFRESQQRAAPAKTAPVSPAAGRKGSEQHRSWEQQSSHHCFWEMGTKTSLPPKNCLPQGCCWPRSRGRAAGAGAHSPGRAGACSPVPGAARHRAWPFKIRKVFELTLALVRGGKHTEG